MDQFYPQGPAAVPANLTAATAQYKRHAWIAMGALLLFVVLYLALAGWFAYKAYSLIAGAFTGGKHGFLGVIFGLPAAFLAVFMLKALFFVKHGRASDDVQIKPEQQPRLFAFLHRLADEAGAPRPHRVYLSPRVNAAVFYDLSVLNLIFPSRKNLEIGLGLVNVLSLGEFKAVLAHEFGHFAQRSMAVGRWVYIAQQIADHIVSKRDALDNFLRGLSHVDLRIAWIGWLLRLIVWSIRSLLEQVFRLVMIAQRALSREMEMQADLVAVSLTGSDALIHALHLAQAADDAWDRALNFANGELGRGHLTTDLFAVQSRLIEHLRLLMGDPDFGRSPPIPSERAAEHRLFRPELAQPPRMWLTHPHNHEREENAKRTYLAAPVDTRSAWELFDDPAALRREMSLKMVPDTDAKPRPIEDTLRALDAEFAIESLKSRYRGAYLGRSPVRWAQMPADLFDDAARGDAQALQDLYPAALAQDLEQLRSLAKEIRMLENVRDGLFTAPGGIIRYRGGEIRRKALPATIAMLKSQLAAIETRVNAHDKQCRSTHRSAAAQLGGGWDAYLVGLVQVLHYAEHSAANLRDAQGFLSNEYNIVTADGKVSKAELARLLKATGVVHPPLEQAFAQRFAVELDPALLERLRIPSFSATMEEFKFPPANNDNISKWLGAVDGWINVACGALHNLRRATLEHLLETEARIAQASIDGDENEPAPASSRVPTEYPVMSPGKERKLQTRLDWWDRFQIADGLWPATARVAVAGAIVFAVVGIGSSVGNATLIIYNGLALPVTVKAGTETRELPPFSSRQFDLPVAPTHIEALSPKDKVIEGFDAPIDQPFADYVYNVGGAAPLMEWSAVYGNASAPAESRLGAPRWSSTAVDVAFAEPPHTINTKGGGGTRRVLTGYGDLSPGDAVELIDNVDDRKRVVRMHAIWDASDSANVLGWLARAGQEPDFDRTIAARLANLPGDVLTLRAEQDAAGEHKAEVCERQARLAQAASTNSGLQYLAARCVEDDARKNAAFIEGHRRWPDDPWFAYASGSTLAGRAQWDEAGSAFEVAMRGAPALANRAAIELMRIQRIAHPQDASQNARLLKASANLRWLVEYEKSPMYSQLQQGHFDQALTASPSDPSSKARMLRLAAASDGADRKIVQQALALKPVEGVDGGTLGAALGLALREKTDLAALDASIDALAGPRAAALRHFVQAVRGGDAKSAVADLDGFDLTLRGQAYVIGIVALGTRAPQEWRRDARALLFAAERPYFE